MDDREIRLQALSLVQHLPENAFGMSASRLILEAKKIEAYIRDGTDVDVVDDNLPIGA